MRGRAGVSYGARLRGAARCPQRAFDGAPRAKRVGDNALHLGACARRDADEAAWGQAAPPQSEKRSRAGTQRVGVAARIHARRAVANRENSYRVNPVAKTPAHSIRSLARTLRISPTTVSEALRGVPRVARATIARVRAAAEQHGYQRNPIAGAVMSHLRRSRSAHYRGTLGLLEIAEAQQPAGARAFSDA